jgi:phage repressor protein C with HTH and peptisase S24 domain
MLNYSKHMKNKTIPWTVIQQRLNSLGKSREWFEHTMGIEKNVLTNWKSRGAPKGRAAELGIALETSADFLLNVTTLPGTMQTQGDPSQRNKQADVTSTVENNEDGSSTEDVGISLYSPTELGRGVPANTVKKMVIPLEFLSRNVKFSAMENLALTPALGDSMDDTYSDGDLLLIDRGINQISDNGIYGISFSGEIFTRRIERRPDGNIAIISDNKKYDPYIVPIATKDNLKVIYRVVFAWRGTKMF